MPASPRLLLGTPTAPRELIRALCNHPRSSEPCVCLRPARSVCDIGFQPGFTLHHSRTRAHLCAAPSDLWCGCPRPFEPYARSQPIAFSRLLPYRSVNFGASLSFISFRSWSLAAHPRATRRPSEALRGFSALFWCYAFSTALRLGCTMLPKLCCTCTMHIRTTDVFAPAQYLFACTARVPRLRTRSLPSPDYRSVPSLNMIGSYCL